MKRELSPLGLPWRVNMCVCTNGRVIECFAKSSVLIGAAIVACKKNRDYDKAALSDPGRERLARKQLKLRTLMSSAN
jgi:hypothetical protein